MITFRRPLLAGLAVVIDYINDLVFFLYFRITHPGSWIIVSLEWILVSTKIMGLMITNDRNPSDRKRDNHKERERKRKKETYF